MGFTPLVAFQIICDLTTDVTVNKSASFAHGHSKQSRSRFPYSDDLIIIPEGERKERHRDDVIFLCYRRNFVSFENNIFLEKRRSHPKWKQQETIPLPLQPQGMLIKKKATYLCLFKIYSNLIL